MYVLDHGSGFSRLCPSRIGALEFAPSILLCCMATSHLRWTHWSAEPRGRDCHAVFTKGSVDRETADKTIGAQGRFASSPKPGYARLPAILSCV